MVTQATGMVQRIPLSQLAIERRQTYQAVYNLALKGDLGPVVREGARLYVLREREETPPK